MKFFINYGYLNDNEIDTFWWATKLSMLTKHEIWSIIMQNSGNMTIYHKTKFLQKIAQDKKEEIDIEVFRLIYKMFKPEESDSQNILISSWLMYEFVVSESNCSESSNTVITMLYGLLKMLKYSSLTKNVQILKKISKKFSLNFLWENFLCTYLYFSTLYGILDI